ncbi:MAG: hypothetical protein MJ238_01465 [Bacilli bacterium]|nr:hypothetical protein [Bacilli bacterium]
MTSLSIFLDETGFFKFLASKALKHAKGNQLQLFLILFGLVSILTVFTSNDIVILTFTPFICYFCKHANIKPTPYLTMEFASANTWSMALIIGNPTNIYLATSAGINFIDYLKVMILPTIAAGLIELVLILVIFQKSLKETIVVEVEDYKIVDKPDMVVGLIHLGICLVLLIASSYLPFEMWLISAICAGSMILVSLIVHIIEKKKDVDLVHTFFRLPWELIPFVISMFIIVLSLNEQGITAYLSNFLGETYSLWTYGYSSFLMCNVVNNIPMSILYSSLPTMADPLKAIYATIIGSNIGAFLTPLGALAGIMFTKLLMNYKVEYGFKKFCLYGVIIGIPTISVALLVLAFVL